MKFYQILKVLKNGTSQRFHDKTKTRLKFLSIPLLRLRLTQKALQLPF